MYINVLLVKNIIIIRRLIQNPKTLNTIRAKQINIMAEPSLYPTQTPPPTGPVRKQSPDSALFIRISKNVNNIAASLRILEERYSTLRNRGQVADQHIIELDKDVRNDIKLLSEGLVELKREMEDIKDKLRLISGEMRNLVKKDEFRVMERYVDMWQPMNFITRNELNKLLEEKSQEK